MFVNYKAWLRQFTCSRAICSRAANHSRVPEEPELGELGSHDAAHHGARVDADADAHGLACMRRCTQRQLSQSPTLGGSLHYIERVDVEKLVSCGWLTCSGPVTRQLPGRTCVRHGHGGCARQHVTSERKHAAGAVPLQVQGMAPGARYDTRCSRNLFSQVLVKCSLTQRAGAGA